MAMDNSLVILSLSVVLLLIALYGYNVEQRIIAAIQFSKDSNKLKKETIALRKELEEQILLWYEINKFCRKELHEMRKNMAELINEKGLLSVTISPADADVHHGQSQLITCIVSGNPVATSISWRFTASESSQQQTLSLGNTAKYSGGNTQNPSLTVLNFQSTDGGTYVCSATNAFGTSTSTTSVLRYIPTCASEWVKQLETNEQGTVVSGSKETLRQDILSGAKVRISFGNYYADTQFTYILNGEVCVQSLFHISKNGWNKHQTKAYWWFLNVCTTGNVHMSRWYVGSHARPSTPETKTKYSVRWFTRQLSSDANHQTPIFCNPDSGSASCGNIKNLIRAVANGAEIHVTNLNGKQVMALEFSNIAYDKAETKVAGTHLWHISQSVVGNHIEFQQNAYWWFNLWSTDGTRDMSRWSVGEHTDWGHSDDKVSIKWFADTCWTLAYEHDKDGQAIDGSLEFLRSAILIGKQVRLVYADNTYGIEADQLVVRNGHVTAQVLGDVSKANLQKFQNNAYWYWQNVATTGNVETIRYNVGDHTDRGSSNDRQATKWFIDSRPWVHAYSNSETGATTHGSKASLIQGVKAGKMLRFTIKSANQPTNDYIAVFNADNADLSPDGNDLGAQHIRSIGLTKDGLYNVAFGSKPFWNFMIATTAGKLDETRWTVGEHQSQGHVNSNSAIDWFVS